MEANSVTEMPAFTKASFNFVVFFRGFWLLWLIFAVIVWTDVHFVSLRLNERNNYLSLMSTFLHRLNEYRQKTGLSREAVGEKLGVSGRYIGMIERGEKEVDPNSPVALLLEMRLKELDQNFVALPEDEPETPTQWEFPAVVKEEAVTGARGRLKALRIAAGYTDLGQFARSVGYSPLIYSQIEDGRSNMSRKMAERVAKKLGCGVDDLLEGSDHPPMQGVLHGTVGETPQINLPAGQKARFVPLLSMAQCGAMEHGDMVAFDDGAYTHEGFLAFNPADPNTFAVTLAGDSMAPVFSPGDVAVIYPNKTPRNGGVVLAKLNSNNGDGVMIKVFHVSGDNVTLSSYNSAVYPPITWKRQDFAWIYPVASVTKIL